MVDPHVLTYYEDDRLVYTLYGLTDEEIAVVQEKK
jgi:DNA-binding CsgD family transcriptional regulator